MNLMKGLSFFTLSLLISQCAAQETIGFEPTARSVLDTAQYWTMVLAKGFTTDGVIQGFNVYTQFPTSQRPLILGLYRPVAGVACRFTLLKYWKPDIAATNTVTKITFSGSDQFEYKAGDTVGYTWTNYGIIPFDYVGPQNYCEDAQQFTTIGGAVPLVANRYGGRAYSFQVITGPATACSSGPCKNGGACVLAGSNSYTCTCAAGFEGTNCEKSYMCSGSTDLSSAKSIGYDATNRGVLDTAGTWTMVLKQGFTTDGVLQGLRFYIGAVRPALFGLYRPVSGCTFTLIKSWAPSITATGQITITFTGSDIVNFKAGDTIGYTWTSLGSVPFDYVGGQNYCEDAQNQVAVGSNVALVDNRYGNRAYSFQALYGQSVPASVNYCTSKPCLNGGACCSTSTSFKCTCPAGTVAPNCAEMTSCDQGPCQNGATCTPTASNYKCTCTTGYTGKNCDVAPPPPTPCAGFSLGGDASNAKFIGYDATNRGVLDTAGTWTMVLKQGFPKDGVLTGLRFFVGAARPALFGLYRPVSGCTFTLIKSWAPSITALGQITISLTGSDQVNFKAGDTIGYTWTSLGSVPFDYVGGQNYCEDAQNQVAVGSNVALVDNRYGNRAYSFQGLFDQSSPVTLNYCVPNPCLNGGNCCSTDKSYQCTCPAGTNPPNCVRPDPCDSAPCNNCGKCSKNGDSFTCKCKTGFSGATCDTVVPDPCDNNPCKNGGECIRADNTRYVCLCAKGYTGSSCQTTIANPCDKKPCANGGICSREGETDYSCSCPKGYSGDTCQTVSDPCASSPCKNGAGCTKSGSSFTCQCAAGYTGSNCEKESDPCASSPCKNGAGCTKSGSSFTCQCAAGYSGSNCEKASGACANSPCQNGGTCVPNGASDYDCICTADYDDGEDCSTYQDPCSSSPCLNGGKCKRLSGLTYQCTCVGDYVGTYCELKKGTDPCSNKPCKNGGTCSTTTPTTYSCKCPKRYEGQMCEKVVCLTEASPTACAGLPFGKYAYCNNCSNWVACKAKKQKLKSCAKRAPNVNYDRSTRTCTADQKTACAGLS